MTDRTFQPPSEEDFLPILPAGTNPATGKKFTATEIGTAVSEAVLGPPSKASEIEPSAVKRYMAGMGGGFENKFLGMTGQGPGTLQGLEQDPAGQAGKLTTDVLGSMLFPQRILPQIAYGAASRALETPGDPLEKFTAGARGAAEFGLGQAAASGLVRGANTVAGQVTPGGKAAAAAEAKGLTLTSGDILDSNLMRLLEEKSIASPSAGQAEQVAKLMNAPGGSPVHNAFINAYKTAQDSVATLAQQTDALAAQAGLPKIQPYGLYAAIRQLAEHSPHTLNAIGDPTIRQRILDIASYPRNRIPKSMTFTEMDELRRALGPIQDAVKGAYEGKKNFAGKMVTSQDTKLWNGAYGSIERDFERWAPTGAPAEVLEASRKMRDVFKNTVLPLREHPVAGKVIYNKYERPEDLIRDLTSPRNKSILDNIYPLLSKEDQATIDALRLAKRGAKEFVRGEPTTGISRPLAFSAALTAPAWMPQLGTTLPWLATAAAAEQGVVHGMNTRLGRAVAGGSPRAFRSPLADAALYSGMRVAIPEGLKQSVPEDAWWRKE